jgi:mannose-1-phosphate guanylyltransferase
VDAEHLGIDTTDSLVVSDRTGRVVVTLDVHDLIVVDTKDAVLVCSRKSAQRVKEVVTKLKQQDDGKRFL